MTPFSASFSDLFHVVYEKLLLFLPDLVVAMVLFIIGLILAKLLSVIALRLSRTLDRLWERSGVHPVLQKGGISASLSVVLSRIVFWFTILIFTIISLDVLNVPTIEALLSRFFLYLPNVFVAFFVILFGYILSNFLARRALISAANSGFTHARLVARFVKFAVVIFSITMALEQLAIGTRSVLVAFAIVFGGMILAAALALGLGGQEIMKRYLEERIKGGEEKDEIDHV